MGAHERTMQGLRGASVTVGTAGWSLRTEIQPQFDGEGTHLTRYASRLRGVEINSSFYRAHRPATYRRWRESGQCARRNGVDYRARVGRQPDRSKPDVDRIRPVPND